MLDISRLHIPRLGEDILLHFKYTYYEYKKNR